MTGRSMYTSTSPPQMIDEDEAIIFSGELMSYVFGETSDRWRRKRKRRASLRARAKERANHGLLPEGASGSTGQGRALARSIDQWTSSSAAEIREDSRCLPSATLLGPELRPLR